MANKTKTTTTAQYAQRLDAYIERLERRFNRTHNALVKARAKRRRLVLVKPAAKPDQTAATLQALTGVVEKPDDLGIPEFLARGMRAQNAADEAAKAAILAEQADKKKRKAAARIGRLKANQAGETKAMPLTGKAALAKINE